MRLGKFAYPVRLLAFGMASASLAANLPVGSKVHFATCTRPGVEKGCVVANSGGATYDVTHAKSGMRPFLWLQGTATIVKKVSFCQQGPIVEHFVPDAAQKMVGCVDPKTVKLPN